MPRKIGDLIDKTNHSNAEMGTASDAAALANAQYAAAKQSYDADQSSLAAGLAKTGPITVVGPDGSYLTYETSTSAPGYRIEVSKGADTALPDDEAPADPSPAPTPSPNPAEPEPTGIQAAEPKPVRPTQVPPFEQPLPSV